MMKRIKNKRYIQKLSAFDLQLKLVEVTIGGAKDQIDLNLAALLFAEYTQRAFPDLNVLSVQPTNTAAALNSVSGVIRFVSTDGKEQAVFGKVHIESNTGKINPLGAEEEYANAEMLDDAGWPVLKPVAVSKNSDYPLLLYPVVEEPALFDQLEASHLTGVFKINAKDMVNLQEYNKQIGEKELQGLRVGKVAEAINSPIQTLFLKRVEKGGRFDQWYRPETIFELPGLGETITWGELLDIKWIINNVLYARTLREIIDQARESLAFVGEGKAFMTITHGDDHAGNILLTNPPVVFDPAFAGWNPASLDVKALAHTGFLPIAAMYYAPQGLSFVYTKKGDTLEVENNMQSLPAYPIQEELARQIIDERIIPVLAEIERLTGDIPKETKRLCNGLAMCALLTVNIAKILATNDGRAVGLLPLTIMFNELNGLPMLQYLKSQISKINEKEVN